MRLWTSVAAVAYCALGGAAMGASGPGLGEPLETDPESGAVIYRLGADPRPADHIYGEQPYTDPTGRRIAIRYYPANGLPATMEIFDLVDGTRHPFFEGSKLRFPAFHAWSEWLYWHQMVGDQRILRRINYLTVETADVATLPADRGDYSYGTVSADHRWYAVSVSRPEQPSNVHLLDLQTGEWRVLLDKPGYHAKHEQFSRDGRNRVLIQLNQMPDVKVVLLAELGVDGSYHEFPADRPHTPRPTGHEAWIGETSRIFFSTAREPDGPPRTLWTGAVGDPAATAVEAIPQRFGHVSVSRDGRYWIGDTGEPGIPIYVGSFATGRVRRLLVSRTVYDGKQWAHTHPYLTADNRWLIFGARRDEHPQVYGARLAEGWLESL